MQCFFVGRVTLRLNLQHQADSNKARCYTPRNQLVRGRVFVCYERDFNLEGGIEGAVKELHASFNFTWSFMEQFHHLVSLIVRNK